MPEECPAEVEQLIDLCLATEPADRPTAKQAFDIISSCSPHSPALAPSTPAPIPLQQASASADNLESWVETPAVETVDIGAIPVGSLDSQSRQQSMGSVQSLAQSMQSLSQQLSAAHRQDHPASALAIEHELPFEGQSTSQNVLHQSQTAQTFSAPMGPGQDLGWQDGCQLRHQQQRHGVKDNNYSFAGSDNAPLPGATVPTHLTNGSKGTLPLGVFGHLYPSPFDMADDGSGDSIWGWQNGQAVSGVHSDPDMTEDQR